MSAREESSPPTLTSSPWSRACFTRRSISASAQGRLRFSFRVMWMSDTGIDRLTKPTLQDSAAFRSASCMRHHTISRPFSPSAATARMPSRSSSPMAGMPISCSGTPAASSALAMAIFSSSVKATPAVCSPSRSVVSLMVAKVVGMEAPRTRGRRLPPK